MGKKFFIIFVFISLCVYQSQAQRWKKYRYEFSYGIGMTNFMGDVGAPEQKLITQYFYLNPYFFRPIGNVGLGYIMLERVHVKSNIHFGWLSADDRYGDHAPRGLKFRSFIVEPSIQLNVYLVKEKRKRNIYRSNNKFRRKLKNVSIPTYFFVGIGGVLVNTNLESIGGYNPNYYPDDNTHIGKKTSFTATVPIGLGFRYRLTNRINLGLEASLRYTVSDIVDNYNPYAGQWIDSYQFLVFSLNYKLKSARSGLPRFKMSY